MRAARQLPFGDVQPVSALGVDDFSYRRGVRFGTLLYDFDRKQVIDLLPERSADFLAAWLKAHPGVKVISRDRGGVYAEGSRQGAPEAIQVADRFHLMQNLGDCLERLVQRVGIRLSVKAPPLSEQAQPTGSSSKTRPPTRSEIAKAATRQRRQERQNAILDLQRQGASIRAIATTLHLSRETVRRYLHELPNNARAPQKSRLDAHAEYLQRRWSEGVHNAAALWVEIRARGYTGSESNLRRYLRLWRGTDPAARPLHKTTVETVSPRAFRRFVLKKVRSPEEDLLLARIAQSNPNLQTTVQLAQDFAQAIHQHQLPLLTTWLLNRGNSTINRLKAIKRAMYGRGKHDLLRRRVLFHLNP